MIIKNSSIMLEMWHLGKINIINKNYNNKCSMNILMIYYILKLLL